MTCVLSGENYLRHFYKNILGIFTDKYVIKYINE